MPVAAETRPTTNEKTAMTAFEDWMEPDPDKFLAAHERKMRRQRSTKPWANADAWSCG
jgi:hypothetical protein